MNAGVQKLFSLGATLAIGGGLGIFAKQARENAPRNLPPQVEHHTPRSMEGPELSPESRIELPEKPLPADAREFRHLSETEKATLQGLIPEYRDSADDPERERILDRVENELYGPETLDLARLVYQDRDRFGTSQVNRVTGMLAGNSSPLILPVLGLAYSRAGDAEKARLLMAAARVRGAGLAEFIARGYEDGSANVRFAALDVVDHQDSATKKALLLLALRSNRPDVALAALGELEVDATPESLPLIMEGLSSRNSEVRDETRGTLQFLLDEEFSDSEAAARWWQRNRHRFDRNLIRAN